MIASTRCNGSRVGRPAPRTTLGRALVSIVGARCATLVLRRQRTTKNNVLRGSDSARLHGRLLFTRSRRTTEGKRRCYVERWQIDMARRMPPSMDAFVGAPQRCFLLGTS